MVLVYRFKREVTEGNHSVFRPRILVRLHGNDMSIEVPALIDTGCDITVIPEGIARALGLNMVGEKSMLYAYRESTEVVLSKADISFIGRVSRENVNLGSIPVLIALSVNGHGDDNDITLGIGGIFDAFDITFMKKRNKIIFKKVAPTYM